MSEVSSIPHSRQVPRFRLWLVSNDDKLPDTAPMSAPVDPRIIVKTCGGLASAVYSVIAANDQDDLPSTYATLAEQFDYSPRQMLRLIQKMEQEGYVEVVRSVGKSHASTITATVLGVTSGVTPVSVQDARCDTHVSPVGVTLGVTSPPTPPVVSVNHDEGELTPQSPQPKKRDGPNYSPSFLVFWKRYPSGHGNKVKTNEVWVKLNPGPELQTAIMDGLERWTSCPRWQRGYVKHAETWLRDRWWEDDPPADEPQPSNGTYRNGKDIGLSTAELLGIAPDPDDRANVFETFGSVR